MPFEKEPIEVLLVEDDPAVQRVCKHLLDSRGYHVTVCPDGETAWETFQNKIYSMIFLDWNLPGMDGVQLCRKMQEHPHRKNCVILMYTGFREPDLLQQVIDAGADDYLLKPIDFELMNIRLAIAEKQVMMRRKKHIMRQKLDQVFAERQDFARQIIQTQENRYKNLSYELHEQLNQTLTSVAFRMKMLESSPELTEIQNVLNQSIQRIRTIAQELRPSVLDDLGLGAALRSLGREFEAKTGISVTVDCLASVTDIPDKNIQLTLYRCVQEILNNIDKHAGATQVWLSCVIQEKVIQFTVKDDGKGFNPDELPAGCGLPNIRIRMELEGGSMKVISAPDQGAEIILQISVTND